MLSGLQAGATSRSYVFLALVLGGGKQHRFTDVRGRTVGVGSQQDEKEAQDSEEEAEKEQQPATVVLVWSPSTYHHCIIS